MFTSDLFIDWQIILNFLPKNQQKALLQTNMEVIATLHLFFVIVGVVFPTNKSPKTYNSLYWNPLQIKILEGYPARRHPT
ncbi:hypothetical protein UABAM_06270 [Candidatus Uabimicrobium amorphum]|uniref:Uncharacterized protein n=2 Tax=Uabimicrobium amorphum TaxID=2596890 RepID=A0A5S9IWK1_UABAM|nr:hypothetical protein UABAM_06270 [Candidatus Uabimicrobium amorphum]